MAIGTSSPTTAAAAAATESATEGSAAGDPAPDETPVLAALTGCGLSGDDTGVHVMDGGVSVELNGQYSGDVWPGDIDCVLTDLGAPESVYARMGSTRALDGTQDSAWRDYTATWTYHPDDGLNVIIVGGSDV